MQKISKIHDRRTIFVFGLNTSPHQEDGSIDANNKNDQIVWNENNTRASICVNARCESIHSKELS